MRMNLGKERGRVDVILIEVVPTHAGVWKKDLAPEMPGKNRDHTLTHRLANRQPSHTHKKQTFSLT